MPLASPERRAYGASRSPPFAQFIEVAGLLPLPTTRFHPSEAAYLALAFVSKSASYVYKISLDAAGQKVSCHFMSGLYSSRLALAAPASLGARLRELHGKAGLPGWKIGAAAGMDSGLLSKIENGKRAITQEQLLALAKFFKIEPAPLEALRIAEEVRRKHGSNPAFAEATMILREDAGELPVNKMSTAVNRPTKSVSNPKKKK